MTQSHFCELKKLTSDTSHDFLALHSYRSGFRLMKQSRGLSSDNLKYFAVFIHNSSAVKFPFTLFLPCRHKDMTHVQTKSLQPLKGNLSQFQNPCCYYSQKLSKA